MTKVIKTKAEEKVEEIEVALVPLEKEAKKIVVKNADDAKKASSFLAKVKAYSDRIEEAQAFFIDPHKLARKNALEQMNQIEDLFKPKLIPIAEITTKVKRAISDYTLAEEKKALAEEERKQKIRDIANAKREEEGKSQILEPVKSVERAAATVKTEEGRTTTKKVWKHQVTDLDALQKDKGFMSVLFSLAVQKDLHNQVLRGMLKTGVREVGGVRIYEDIDVSVSAN